jgi:hypothetical protein
LLLAVIGWLDRREREVLAYLISNSGWKKPTRRSREGDSTPLLERRSSFLEPCMRSPFQELVTETAMT